MATSADRASRTHVDRLHQRAGLLQGERFGETGDGTTEGRDRARGVVAVAAAEPGAGHEERSRLPDLVVQPAHGGVQQLDPDPIGLPPAGEVHVLDRPFVVECLAPVDAVDRTGGEPVVKVGDELVGVGCLLDREDLDAARVELLGEGGTHPAAVGADHDSRAAAQLDTGWCAGRERRSDGRDRHAPREPVRVRKVSDGGSGGHDGRAGDGRGRLSGRPRRWPGRAR